MRLIFPALLTWTAHKHNRGCAYSSFAHLPAPRYLFFRVVCTFEQLKTSELRNPSGTTSHFPTKAACSHPRTPLSISFFLHARCASLIGAIYQIDSHTREKVLHSDRASWTAIRGPRVASWYITYYGNRSINTPVFSKSFIFLEHDEVTPVFLKILVCAHFHQNSF